MNDALIWNFPAKIFALAMLLVVLFEEDGAAGIGDECSRGRKANVSGAILNIYKTAKKRGVTGHVASFLMDSSIVNSTNGFMRKKLWKMFLNETTTMTSERDLGSTAA
jgi:hypothetical protein